MPTSKYRLSAIAGFVTVVSLGLALSGCGTSTPPSAGAAQEVAQAASDSPADILSAAIKEQAAKAGRTTRMVASDATTTTNVNGGGKSGTRESPATVQLADGRGWLTVNGVMGYESPSLPEAMIVVDGSTCTSVTGVNEATNDVILTVLNPCPAD